MSSKRASYMEPSNSEPKEPQLHFDPIELLDRLWSAADAYDWKEAYGRSGRSTFLVYRAAQRIARRANRVELDLSIRDLVKESGYGVATVKRALDRLCGYWLRRVTKGGASREGMALASRYRFLEAPLEHEQDAASLEAEVEPSHDAFARRPVAWLIYEYVLSAPEPPSVKEVADAVDCVRSTVYNNLKLLLPSGLLVRNEDGRLEPGPAEPHDLATFRGTAGTSHKRAERIEHDRKRHREHHERRSVTYRAHPVTGELLTPRQAYDLRRLREEWGDDLVDDALQNGRLGLDAEGAWRLPSDGTHVLLNTEGVRVFQQWTRHPEAEALANKMLDRRERRRGELRRVSELARKQQIRERIARFNEYGTDILHQEASPAA